MSDPYHRGSQPTGDASEQFHRDAFQNLVSARAERLAGLYVAITRRCPLRCEHCSTRSSPQVGERELGPHLERFFASIGKAGTAAHPPPRYVYFTGGEPLLHPELVTKLAIRARSFGARTHLISSGFFGKSSRLSPVLDTLLSRYIDGISFSWDIFHERFLEFAHLRRAVQWSQERGLAVSIQHTRVAGAEDPSAARFRHDLPGIPVFSSPLTRVGRAADNDLVPLARQTESGGDTPCLVASWPVISYYGQIVACCNQTIIDAEPDQVPEHLGLGTVFEHTWEQVCERRSGRATLDIIETHGPRECLARAPEPGRSPCDECRALPAQARPARPAPSQALYFTVREIRRERLMAYVRRDADNDAPRSRKAQP